MSRMKGSKTSTVRTELYAASTFEKCLLRRSCHTGIVGRPSATDGSTQTLRRKIDAVPIGSNWVVGEEKKENRDVDDPRPQRSTRASPGTSFDLNQKPRSEPGLFKSVLTIEPKLFVHKITHTSKCDEEDDRNDEWSNNWNKDNGRKKNDTNKGTLPVHHHLVFF